MWRKAERVRRVLITQAPEGKTIRITGRLELVDRPLRAPISGRLCAAWSVDIIEPDPERNGTRAIKDSEVGDFALRDESGGYALVRVERANIAFEHDVDRYREARSDEARRLRAALRTSISPLELADCRYSEGVLAPGENITVVGVARREIDPSGSAGSYREPPTRLVFEASAGPLLILDEVPPT